MGEKVVRRQGLILCLVLLAVCNCARNQLKKIRNMQFRDIDPEAIADGIYTGKYVYKMVPMANTNLAQVTVSNHRNIEGLVIQTSETLYAQNPHAVADEILKRLTPNVEAVCGAITTSKALMKAVENALLKGMEMGDENIN